MWIVLLLLALATPTVRPDPRLTPGAVRPLSRAVICSTRWGTDRRFVTLAMKKQVAAAYGLPWKDHARVEFDHVVPRELGGADAVINLFPQVWAEAHLKDALENRLHRLVCAGQLPLKQAQTEIATDWIAAYDRYVTHGVTPKK